MRFIEGLLFAALFLELLRQFIVPLRLSEGWQYLFPLLLLFIFLFHVIFEKPRWQLLPAYVLLLGLLSHSVVQFAFLKKRDISPVLHWVVNAGKIFGLLIALILLAVGVFLSNALPVFTLPKPSGPYAVGIQEFHFIDKSRQELFTPDPGDKRELMLHVWYPANLSSDVKPQSYWPEVGLVGPVILDRLGLPTFLLNYMELSKSNSYRNAPLSNAETIYPLLVFSHGYAIDDDMGHQALMEDLASHGYIVFSMNHPYESLSAVYPDGRTILADPEAFWSLLNGTHGKLSLDDQLGVWVEDGRYILDRLVEINSGEIPSTLASRLDLEKIGVFGYSFGGAMSTEVCLIDPRCKVGANMDGTQYGYVDFSLHHLRTPFMFFYSENDSGMNSAIYQSAENWSYQVTIHGATHASFTDKVLWSPYIKYSAKFIAWGFGPIDANRMIQIQRAYLLALFDRHLKGNNVPLLEDSLSIYPEVEYQYRSPK
jgi:predicted dienelactone hydrolase